MGNKVLTKSGIGFIIHAGDVGHYTYHGHETPDIDVAKAVYRVVVSGHSHKAKAETRDGVLYLNPGSAGTRQFDPPVTLMWPYIEG